MTEQDAQKQHLNKQLEAIAWGLFLVMLGCLWLIPNEQVPEGTWLIGVGIIMLGLNLARYLFRVKLSGFSIVLGIIAFCLGIGAVFGIEIPIFPILIIIWGLSVVLEPFLKKKPQ